MEPKKCRLAKLPNIADDRGNLILVQNATRSLFHVNLVFCIFGVPAGTRRGEHALRSFEELIVAVSGAFDVISDDGKGRTSRRLASAESGLDGVEQIVPAPASLRP